jgi:hypothetical protein
MSSSLTWFEQDLVVWAPDIVGSVLFLASGYLALIETCHARWAWQPSSVSWWVVFVNLLGCMGFMASALFAFVTSVPRGDAVTISLLFTLIGAIGFLAGSLLMMVESAAYASHRRIEPV